ncbi:MAG: hypothetical protein KTR18_09655 [Acidiferrobacterales bacterium]|nr:hypothetical protein [Acidiferrobacterales bacterium]
MKIVRAVVAWWLLMWFPGAWALGPVDGEIIISLWNNQFESDVLNGEVDAGSLTVSGEIWVGDNWGLRAARYEADLEETAISNQSRTQFELRRRFFSLSDNNFFAVGVGAESIDLLNGESSDGLRLSAEARLAVTPVTYIYGRGAYLPDMSDAGNFSNLTGSELEVGLSVTPFPFISIKAGYMRLNLDFDNDEAGMESSTESDGFLIGAGIHW